MSGAKASCSAHGSPAGWRNQSASADFHELRQGFIPPKPKQVMEYNILDFSDWEDRSAFEGKFAKLLNGLDLFYKKAKE